MKAAVYPGSFDPITYGHVDIIERASRIFDKLIVAVVTNPSKRPLFSMEERIDMIKEAIRHVSNVEVDGFDGLLVNYLRERKIDVVIRGMRAVTDFDYEFQMALTNRKLNKNVEIVFLLSDSKYLYLTSRMVKEIASFGGCVRGMVPPYVEEMLLKKLKVSSSTSL
ncbi:MAG: pantetheine-phosphate adenylyltransferase [Synergistetes bacterium]|nr:pantetheine-phosphate adenylyltransferase [Synergistota bacterium]MCX8127191.1 pantetheine-phosphate adenylyltransferase [Synergistota bacterium]MDW8191923.1 pantetheine-phosphate adenylyltransferase [Synergistota bacterium]